MPCFRKVSKYIAVSYLSAFWTFFNNFKGKSPVIGLFLSIMINQRRLLGQGCCKQDHQCPKIKNLMGLHLTQTSQTMCLPKGKSIGVHVPECQCQCIVKGCKRSENGQKQSWNVDAWLEAEFLAHIAQNVQIIANQSTISTENQPLHLWKYTREILLDDNQSLKLQTHGHTAIPND